MERTFPPMNPADMKSFTTLKIALIKPPVLFLPLSNLRYVLDTDACNKQLDFVLMQLNSDQSLRPIGYFSRTLSDAEKNYDTAERECLAIVWAVLLLRPYLYGSHFEIRTDHDSLKRLLDLSAPTGKLARFRLRPQEYDYEVSYRPGIKHLAPNVLSWLNTDGHDETDLDDDIPVLNLTKADSKAFEIFNNDDDPMDYRKYPLPKAYNEDPISKTVFVEEQFEDSDCQRYASFVPKAESQIAYDNEGYLVRIFHLDGALQRIVPVSLRKRVLYLSHYLRLQGHPGTNRMYNTLRRDFYWKFMANDVYNLVQNFNSCAKSRGTTKSTQNYLQLFPANGPFEFVGIDLLGPLPKTKTGKRHILVISDLYSNLARSIPMHNITAPLVAASFLTNWEFSYRIPHPMITDNGPQFIASFFRIFCVVLGIRRIPITAYHPRTNSYNKTLAARLCHYVSEHQDDWDLYVQPLTYAYNSQIHKSTGTSPFSFSLTQHSSTSITDVTSTANATDMTGPPSTRELCIRILERLSNMFESTDHRTKLAQATYKRYFDKKVRFTAKFEEGQLVFVDRPRNEPKNSERTRRKHHEVQTPAEIQRNLLCTESVPLRSRSRRG